MTRIVLGALVGVTLISASVYAEMRQYGCGAAVERALSDAGVASSDISDIAYIRQHSTDDDGGIAGYTAWVRLKSCGSGYVVVDLSRDCWVDQIYTDGGCQVRGIKAG